MMSRQSETIRMTLGVVMALVLMVAGLVTAYGHRHPVFEPRSHGDTIVDGLIAQSDLDRFDDGFVVVRLDKTRCHDEVAPRDGGEQHNSGCDCACHSLGKMLPIRLQFIAPPKAGFDLSVPSAPFSTLDRSVDDPPIILAII